MLLGGGKRGNLWDWGEREHLNLYLDLRRVRNLGMRIRLSIGFPRS